VAFAVASTAAFAAGKPAVKAVPAPKVVKCAVTGEEIGAPSAAFKSTVYKGHTYYFCCPGCPEKFKEDPAKYAKPSVAYPVPAPVKAKA
jgi:YHS domain-containing protein